MNPTKRPLPVTIIAWVYIVVGIGGFVSHGMEAVSARSFQLDTVEVEFVELLAILCGVFLLRGHNWARWLALIWIGFHVILSAFANLREFAVHALFFIVIAWYLFRPEATSYFHSAQNAA